jgi:hypothetical protein
VVVDAGAARHGAGTPAHQQRRQHGMQTEQFAGHRSAGERQMGCAREHRDEPE